jgi:hypothetical protein
VVVPRGKDQENYCSSSAEDQYQQHCSFEELKINNTESHREGVSSEDDEDELQRIETEQPPAKPLYLEDLRWQFCDEESSSSSSD